MKRIDPRGPRFSAAVTSVVLALALVLPGPWNLVAAGLQWLAFAAGALLGLRFQPFGIIFRIAVRPRLQAPRELEDPRAPRFAQAVGLGFVTVALLGRLAGAEPVYLIAIGGALAAALLNAIFDVCLGCEMYVRIMRIAGRPIGPLREPLRQSPPKTQIGKNTGERTGQ